MRLFEFIIFAAAIVAGGCTGKVIDITGSWQRPAQEPQLMLTGTEQLTLNADSTFAQLNLMEFSHGDSALNCKAKFRIAVCGKWSQSRNGDVTLTYDVATLDVDTIGGTFSLTATDPGVVVADSIAGITRRALTDGIARFYNSGFASINANGGLQFNAPELRQTELFVTISGQPVSWTSNSKTK